MRDPVTTISSCIALFPVVTTPRLCSPGTDVSLAGWASDPAVAGGDDDDLLFLHHARTIPLAARGGLAGAAGLGAPPSACALAVRIAPAITKQLVTKKITVLAAQSSSLSCFHPG